MSAVVLSLGEPFTPRAIASLASQTQPPAQVILIENVSPFFQAMNAAVRQVTTPFFVQVDADMILDSGCIAALRAAMREDTGISVGRLRDPLEGQVVGVKLFRTECFRYAGFTDSISPDTDFIAAIKRHGWKTEILPGAGTLGEHRPDYTPAYTFRKHLLEGRRYRHRGAREGLQWRVARLEESAHELAPLAQLALAHGFFLASARDDLKPAPDDPRAATLQVLLASSGRAGAGSQGLPLVEPRTRLREVFRRSVRAGAALADAGTGVRGVFEALAGAGRDWSRLVAKLGFGHGLLAPGGAATSLRRDERALEIFLSLGQRGGSGGSLGHLLLARAARRMRGLRVAGERLRW